MAKSKDKALRYSNLIRRTVNWRAYLWKKLTGFGQGFEFNVRGFGRINVPRRMLGAFRENFFDDIYFRYLPGHLFEGKTRPTIVDVGANVGYFSLATFSKMPQAKIIAFEPHPYCYKVLQGYQHTFSDFDWDINNSAVGAEAGTMQLHTDTLDGFTTLAGTHHQEGDVTVDVPTTSLNDFLTNRSEVSIDLLKLDCEGAEYSILFSLEPSLLKRVNALSIETHPSDTEGHDHAQLCRYLADAGYQWQAMKEEETGYIWAWR